MIFCNYIIMKKYTASNGLFLEKSIMWKNTHCGKCTFFGRVIKKNKKSQLETNHHIVECEEWEIGAVDGLSHWYSHHILHDCRIAVRYAATLVQDKPARPTEIDRPQQ